MGSDPKRRHLYTIPTGAPFLPSLARTLTEGGLFPGFPAPGDPFALADATLYLPTRRAARAAARAFADLAGSASVLPSIRSLGNLDDPDFQPDPLGGIDWESEVAPLAAIDPTHRQLVLTRLVLDWSRRAAVPGLISGPGAPRGRMPGDAARVAAALAALADQVTTADADWDRIDEAVGSDLGSYWDFGRSVLHLIRTAWPAYLTEAEGTDPAGRVTAALRAEAARLRIHGSPGPVIAAGTTGSIPATADLLAAIANLDNGAIILPGLDIHMDSDSWAAIGSALPPGAAPEPADPKHYVRDPEAGHPQYGMKQLLNALEADRDEFRSLGEEPEGLGMRSRILSRALGPAVSIGDWSGKNRLAPSQQVYDALAGLAWVEADNEREEASAVACILRQALQDEDARVALVTPDRGLARRVATEMRRWNVNVDDSAGCTLMQTPSGALALLVARVGFGAFSPHEFLAILRHPLSRFATGPAAKAVDRLERLILRGVNSVTNLSDLKRSLEALKEHRDLTKQRTQKELYSEPVATLIDDIDSIFAPILRFGNSGSHNLSALADAHARCVCALAGAAGAPFQPAPPGLPVSPETEDLADLFERLRENSGSLVIGLADYPALFSELTAGRRIRPDSGGDARLQIWGGLESRLQRVDTIVLGGLNEGVWPGQNRIDPFLSWDMRGALGLPLPERSIGLAAHDFSQALGNPTVWMTRPRRQNGTPRVTSRWVQRLLAYLGEDAAGALRDRGEQMLGLARRLDAPIDPIALPRQPAPAPPVAMRPRRLSVTEIQTLVRDPYAIYARHILKLRALDPLGARPGARERGILFHDVLGEFVGRDPDGPYGQQELATLLEIGRERFATFSSFPEVSAFWWPRFEGVARWFIQEESEKPSGLHRTAECSGVLELAGGFTLSARADRIDRHPGGTLEIIDYKTGQVPSRKMVDALLAPQLPLEAMIAGAGGFQGVMAAPVAALSYYQLIGRVTGGKVENRAPEPDETTDIPGTLQVVHDAGRRLQTLLAWYQVAGNPYLSQRIPDPDARFTGDYDHLARVSEWGLEAGDP